MTRTLFAAALLACPLATGCDPAGSASTVTVGPPPGAATADPTRPLRPGAAVPITGPLAGDKDVSGIGRAGDFLVLVSDETAHAEVLKKTGDGFATAGTVPLGTGELDLEAVAVDGDTVYVAGSHSRVRPKSAPTDDYPTARKKMTEVATDLGRDVVARFRLNPDGTAGPVEAISLRAAIGASPALRPFAELPGKENGVDIEGLAVKDGVLVVGFRSPVLRSGFVPVLVTPFDRPSGADVRFVNLGGRGVRDLAAVSGGFLILAGPATEGEGTYQLYRWNGYDCLPGAAPAGDCRWLADLPAGPKAKPEGLAVVGEDAAGFDVLLVCDGVPGGGPTRYRVPVKP